MPKKLNQDVPQNYPVCQHTHCPLASHCLHQIVYDAVLARDNYLQLINPKHCTQNEHCPHFRTDTPTVYARGFLGMQQQMLPAQYQTFMTYLIAHFGRTPYFERRRGDWALTPQEQDIVRQALEQAGVTKPLEFDQYEEGRNWYD